MISLVVARQEDQVITNIAIITHCFYTREKERREIEREERKRKKWSLFPRNGHFASQGLCTHSIEIILSLLSHSSV